MDDKRARARMSVRAQGVGLAGMTSWGDNASSGMKSNLNTKMMLLSASTSKSLGVVKLSVVENVIQGTQIPTNKKKFEDKLDALVKHVKDNIPAFFALFKEPNFCIFVSFVPDKAVPSKKMLYASSKNPAKDVILESIENCKLDEFHVTDLEELNFAEYDRRANVVQPKTEMEILREEQSKMETGGSYGFLANMARQSIKLPGLDGDGGDPKALLKKMKEMSEKRKSKNMIAGGTGSNFNLRPTGSLDILTPSPGTLKGSSTSASPFQTPKRKKQQSKRIESKSFVASNTKFAPPPKPKASKAHDSVASDMTVVIADMKKTPKKVARPNSQLLKSTLDDPPKPPPNSTSSASKTKGGLEDILGSKRILSMSQVDKQTSKSKLNDFLETSGSGIERTSKSLKETTEVDTSEPVAKKPSYRQSSSNNIDSFLSKVQATAETKDTSRVSHSSRSSASKSRKVSETPLRSSRSRRKSKNLAKSQRTSQQVEDAPTESLRGSNSRRKSRISKTKSEVSIKPAASQSGTGSSSEVEDLRVSRTKSKSHRTSHHKTKKDPRMTDANLKDILGSTKDVRANPAPIPSPVTEPTTNSYSEPLSTPPPVKQDESFASARKPHAKPNKPAHLDLDAYEEEVSTKPSQPPVAHIQAQRSKGISGVLRGLALKGNGLLRRLSFQAQPVKLTSRDIANLPADDGELSYDEIRQMQSSGIYGKYESKDIELMLSSKEFYRLFKIDKASYAKLPKRRKNKLKKRVQIK